MANNPQVSYAAVDAEANALAPLMNSGKFRIYSGAVPTRCDDSIGAAVLLAELTLGGPAFGASVNGVITANSISPATAINGGTASFCRAFNAAGTTAYIQGTVGVSGCDLNLTSVGIGAGVQVSVSGFTHTIPRGA